jgi:hypothetical protein
MGRRILCKSKPRFCMVEKQARDPLGVKEPQYSSGKAIPPFRLSIGGSLGVKLLALQTPARIRPLGVGLCVGCVDR